MNKRLLAALSTFAIIAILAGTTLDGGIMRDFVWILMAALAVKTYVAYRAGW